MKTKEVTVAFTGASGAPYGLRLIECLLKADYTVHLLISSAARVVLKVEHGLSLSAHPEKALGQLRDHLQLDAPNLFLYGKDDWFSPVASGSSAPKAMVICPCSSGTMSAVATGMSDNLVERAADVVLKEKGQLILMPRESPFNAIQLEHMLKLSRLGVTIMPASPGFYHQPKTINDLIDFMVARILDHLGVDQEIMQPWGYGNR